MRRKETHQGPSAKLKFTYQVVAGEAFRMNLLTPVVEIRGARSNCLNLCLTHIPCQSSLTVFNSLSLIRYHTSPNHTTLVLYPSQLREFNESCVAYLDFDLLFSITYTHDELSFPVSSMHPKLRTKTPHFH